MKKSTLFLSLIAFASCNKIPPSPPPRALYLEMKYEGKDLSLDTLKTIKLYWLQDGMKRYENVRYADTDPILDNPGFGIYFPTAGTNSITQQPIADSTKPLLYSLAQGFHSGGKGGNEFYLEYSNGETDTIFVADHDISSSLPENRKVKYNGQYAEADTALYNSAGVTPFICNKK